MTDRELALRYEPIVHFDANETIPLLAIGWTVMHETQPSPSFRRTLTVPEHAACVVEYAYFWDYDIQHMYDLEHIWVTVGKDGHVLSAEGSFHGKYLTLLVPELTGSMLPTDEHVHAFCQPGKHAFAAVPDIFRVVPGWYESCNTQAGGQVLVGGPFQGVYAPTSDDDARSMRYIREHLTFHPTMCFTGIAPEAVNLMTWHEMKQWIPGRVMGECARLRQMYGE